MGGQWLLEENQWPLEWLLRRGLDVALPVLPLHAARAGSHRGARFPSSDPRLTNEGFRQAVTDIRTLVRRAVVDKERGYGNLPIRLDDDALNLWATMSDGDGRRGMGGGIREDGELASERPAELGQRSDRARPGSDGHRPQ